MDGGLEAGIPRAQGQKVSLHEIKSTTLKPVDAWWTVLVIDPLAIRVMWLLVRIWPGVTPTTVTLLSFGLGIGSAVCFVTGNFLAGALLFQASFTMDCIDGKLARLRRESSEFGAFLDGFVNHSVYLLALGGLIWSQRQDVATLSAGLGLLCLRCVHIFVNTYVKSSDPLTWTTIRGEANGWLEKHRLLPPMSFPDKQLILFSIGPILGLFLFGFMVNLALESILLIVKLKRVIGDLSQTQGSRET